MEEVSAYDILAKESDILNYLKNEVQKVLTGEDTPIQIVLLSIFSALLLKKPFGVVMYSASSAGKSFVRDSVLDCFGPKLLAIEQDGSDITLKPGFGFIRVNSLTLPALTRLAKPNPSCFDKKVIFLGEISDAASDDIKQVNQALRQFVSDGHYDRILTNESTKKPMRLYLQGWCACISESAEEIVEIQWGNRFIFINLDESAQQNKAIAEFQAQEYLTPWDVSFPNVQLFEDLVWIYQDDKFKCRDIPVVNPWAKDIIDYFIGRYGDDVRLRRYIPILLRSVETITRLQYQQRETVSHPSGMMVLMSQKRDNAKVLELFDQMLLHTLKNITTGAINLLKRLQEELEDSEWTIRKATQQLDASYSTIKNKTRMLANYGLINHVGKRGKAYVYRVSKTGRNYSTIGLQRTWSDYMSLLPEREIEITPNGIGYRTQGVGHISGPITDVSVEPIEGIGLRNNGGIGPSTVGSDKSEIDLATYLGRADKMENLIYLWLDNSEDGELHIREILYGLTLNGFNRDEGEKLIDEYTRRGSLFERKPGIIRRV